VDWEGEDGGTLCGWICLDVYMKPGLRVIVATGAARSIIWAELTKMTVE
jgi:hypothetical protein